MLALFLNFKQNEPRVLVKLFLQNASALERMIYMLALSFTLRSIRHDCKLSITSFIKFPQHFL